MSSTAVPLSRTAPPSRPSGFLLFLERWLDRWLSAVPGREHHDAWAAEVMRLGL